MAITSEIIGKLGGAEVEVIPVSGTVSGNQNSEVVMHTVEAPASETWMVALQGTLNSSSAGSLSAQLFIGDSSIPRNAPNGQTGLIHVGTGTINVKLRRNNSLGSDSFTGHVYTVKL